MKSPKATYVPKPGNPFGERLDEARRDADLGFNELDKAAGRPPNSGYTSRKISSTKDPRPGPEIIEKLAEATGVNFEWLALGRGPKKPGRRYGDLPGWAEAEADARIEQPKLDWEIRGAREMTVVREPRPGKLTSAFVLRLALLFRDTSTDAERQRMEELESIDRTKRAEKIASIAPPDRSSRTSFQTGRPGKK